MEVLIIQYFFAGIIVCWAVSLPFLLLSMLISGIIERLKKYKFFKNF